MSIVDFLNAPVPPAFQGHRPFIKMHGLRNYFVIMDNRGIGRPLSSQVISRICDVHEGIGAEQLVTIEPPSTSAEAKGAQAAIRIFNTDGWETGACGNATRCVAQLLFEEFGTDRILLETKGGVLACSLAGDGVVSVILGPISMDWRKVPLSHAEDTSHLPLGSGPLQDGLGFNIGNTQAVFFVDRLSSIDVPLWANPIQKHPLFPEGANVAVVERVDASTLNMVVWERPGMLTEACGTGACVAAYAARLRGLVAGKRVMVHLPGGALDIELLDGDMVKMTGPIAICGSGYVPA